MINALFIFTLASAAPAKTDKPCALTYQISRSTQSHSHRKIRWQQINDNQQLISEDDLHHPQYLATFSQGQLYELKVAYPEINKGVQFFHGDLKTIGLDSFKSLMMQQLNIKNPRTKHIEIKQWKDQTVEFSQVSNDLQSIQLQWHPEWQWPVFYMAQQANLSYQVNLTDHQMTQCKQAKPDWKNIEWMDFSDLGDNEADDFAKQFINMGHTH